MKLTSKLYNILKYISTTGIPAVVFLLGVIGDTLDLPWMIKVIAIVGGVGTFIGMLIGVTSNTFWKDKEIVAKKEDLKNGIQ